MADNGGGGGGGLRQLGRYLYFVTINYIKTSTLNMLFSVTYYLEQHISMFLLIIDVNFYLVKMLIFYKVQITNLIVVGEKWDVQ